LSRVEFDDVLQVRLLVEGEAAERGALRLSDAEREHLALLSERMRTALGAADAKGCLDADEDFHRLLDAAAGPPTLPGLIETVWLKVGPISNRLFDEPCSAARLNDAHEDAAVALLRRAIERDLFVAAQTLRLHCRG